MRVLFHQLFQSESRKLYRNLGIFSLSFAPINNALAVFRVFHTLSGAEGVAACGFLHGHLRTIELLATRSKELRDVVDRVVLWPSVAAGSGSGLPTSITLPVVARYALVFVFIAVMAVAVIRVAVGSPGPGATRSQFFQKLRRYLFQKA